MIALDKILHLPFHNNYLLLVISNGPPINNKIAKPNQVQRWREFLCMQN